MNSKEFIINALGKAGCESFPRPDLSSLEKEAVKFEDPFAKFCESVKGAGGNVVELKGSPDDVVRSLYPEAEKVASTLEGFGGFNPDEVAAPGDLDGTDVAIVKGEFGVAENGAVWLKQNFRHRALLFISEALVIVMDRNAIVNNMHEAYLRLGETAEGYGIFISGPSKTADIEQALVFGAHGARSLTVLVR